MAFPSSNQSSLETKWMSIQSAAGRIKDRSSFITALPLITRRQVLEHHNYLIDIRTDLDVLTTNATTNGLVEYARTQVSNPSLDVVAEYNTMRSAVGAVLNWDVSNFPNTAGILLVHTFEAGTQRVLDVNLTGGESSAYKAQLTTLINTIS